MFQPQPTAGKRKKMLYYAHFCQKLKERIRPVFIHKLA